MSDLISRQGAIDALGEKPVGETDWMEGKPVWVEYNLHLSDKDARRRMWIIIQQIFPWEKDNELIYYSGFVFDKEGIGETWQAYRMERK